MFVENKEFEAFATEFKNSFEELVDNLNKLWKEYDFNNGVGDPYADSKYSKEEIEKMNNELEKNINKLVVRLANDFKLSKYKVFIESLLSYLSKQYKEMRWFYNQLNYNADGRILDSIDMYSIVGDPHQGKLNFVIGSTDLVEKDDIRNEILEKYKDKLDEQAKVIIDDYKDELEVLWDQIIFIDLKKLQYIDFGNIIKREF